MKGKKNDHSTIQPPSWASRFLKWYCDPAFLEEVEGDLFEIFNLRVKKYGLRKAQLLYIKEVLLFFKPSSFKQLTPTVMPNLFGNYLKIALRNLFRQKSYSFINIGGLSIALAVTLLMLLWVQDEWNMDKFHANGDRLFLLKRMIPLEDGTVAIRNSVPYPLLQAVQNELPEVEKFIPLSSQDEMTLSNGNQTFRAKGAFANANYFESFSFPIIAGNIKDLDQKQEAIAISESLANKFFGDKWLSNAIGTTINILDLGDFLISAVYKDFPTNSSIQQDFIYSIDNFVKRNDWMLHWGNSGMGGALLLTKGANVKEVVQKIEKIYKAQQEGDFIEGCTVQKFEDGYLYGQFDEQGKVAGGRIEYVQMFAIAALLLLIISCINFVNLATARASKRAKEVGVRKTIGAGKNSLITQFMVEAGVITFLSVGLGLLLAQLALPQVQLITEKMLQFDYKAPMFWGVMGMIILFATLLSGTYPAFVLSSFRPMEVLKGQMQNQSGSIGLRKGLVIIQFVLALLLVVGAFVIKEQVEYIQNKNLGINKDNLIVIQKEEAITNKYEVLKDKLLQAPGIDKITICPISPIDIQSSTSGVTWAGKQLAIQYEEFHYFWASNNFLETFDIPLVAGRFYREDAPFDTTSIVLNKKAVEMMGLEDPIGKTVKWWRHTRQIIGVVENFHIQSLYEDIKPLGIFMSDRARGLLVKAKEGEMKAAIGSLQNVFSEVLPAVYLHYNFVDAAYQQKYKSEVLTGKLANYFAIISIIIACLGLFGLSTFLAEQKTKEIGIRKVLGASMGNLIALLSKDFLLLVIIGLMIGIPISWYLLNGWLTNFAYTIALKWWMFALPVFLAILIASVTIGIQAVRAALNNPIDALTSE
jgi:ABC-type antimicrobial peptide transport system permease subunit